MKYLFTFRTPLVIDLPDHTLGLVIAAEGTKEEVAGGRVRLSMTALVFDKGYRRRTLAESITMDVDEGSILSAQQL